MLVPSRSNSFLLVGILSRRLGRVRGSSRFQCSRSSQATRCWQSSRLEWRLAWQRVNFKHSIQKKMPYHGKDHRFVARLRRRTGCCVDDLVHSVYAIAITSVCKSCQRVYFSSWFSANSNPAVPAPEQKSGSCCLATSPAKCFHAMDYFCGDFSGGLIAFFQVPLMVW